MAHIISVDQMVHRYGTNLSVDHLSFQVNQGEVFGLLGPNGAGKTTVVRLLNGLLEPLEGSIDVLGKNPVQQGAEIRSVTGVLTETPALYERLTARQNLEFFGTLAGMSPTEIKSRTAELLTFFGLEERADHRTGTYSKGMKQRLSLARALLNRPKLLFMDEPTSGLDPEAAQQVRTLIEDVRRREGSTVFLCTHHLDEAQRLCDRLLIINKGRRLAQGSLAELRRLIAPGLWLQIQLWSEISTDLHLEHLPAVLSIQRLNGKDLRLQVADEAAIPQIVAALVGLGAQIVSVQPQEISLEEVYFAVQNGPQGEAK